MEFPDTGCSNSWKSFIFGIKSKLLTCRVILVRVVRFELNLISACHSKTELVYKSSASIWYQIWNFSWIWIEYLALSTVRVSGMRSLSLSGFLLKGPYYVYVCIWKRFFSGLNWNTAHATEIMLATKHLSHTIYSIINIYIYIYDHHIICRTTLLLSLAFLFVMKW